VLKLNLGACDRPAEGFLSIDIAPPADQIVDLGQYPWPWDSGSVEAVIAHDLLEHLPDRVKTMNELHRILAPGARADIIVPNAAKGAGQWQDPTHKSPFCLNSFQYFRHESFAQQRLARSYGISASFRVVLLEESRYQDDYEEVFKIHAVLEAVK
jgi:predicted SAM-dependent methyltransferase